MRFITITLIVHAPDPFTGAQKSTRDRFREALDSALLAEELGFDGFGVGERHERPFISSSPTVRRTKSWWSPSSRSPPRRSLFHMPATVGPWN